MAHPYRRQWMRLHRLHPWTGSGLLKFAAIGGLAILVALALLSGKQRGFDGHAVASWAASDEPSAAAPQVHSLEREQQLDLAFTAAFGGPDEVIRRVGTMHEPTRFSAGLLVATPFGPVLLSEGQVLAPRAASTGKLAAFYLARTADGFRSRARFLPAIESGSMGRLSDWSVRTDLGRYPVVEVKGDGSWRGSSCSWTTLLELTPQGPAELVTIPTAFDNSEALPDGHPTRVEGRIRPLAAARSILVSYAGSAAFAERYVRQGSRYALAGGGRSRMKSC